MLKGLNVQRFRVRLLQVRAFSVGLLLIHHSWATGPVMSAFVNLPFSGPSTKRGQEDTEPTPVKVYFPKRVLVI